MRDYEQLVKDILEEYKDELTEEACDNCENCGPLVMCSFHSVLSTLTGETWTRGAIERSTKSLQE